MASSRRRGHSPITESVVTRSSKRVRWGQLPSQLWTTTTTEQTVPVTTNVPLTPTDLVVHNPVSISISREDNQTPGEVVNTSHPTRLAMQPVNEQDRHVNVVRSVLNQLLSTLRPEVHHLSIKNIVNHARLSPLIHLLGDNEELVPRSSTADILKEREEMLPRDEKALHLRIARCIASAHIPPWLGGNKAAFLQGCPVMREYSRARAKQNHLVAHLTVMGDAAADYMAVETSWKSLQTYAVDFIVYLAVENLSDALSISMVYPTVTMLQAWIHHHQDRSRPDLFAADRQMGPEPYSLTTMQVLLIAIERANRLKTLTALVSSWSADGPSPRERVISHVFIEAGTDIYASARRVSEWYMDILTGNRNSRGGVDKMIYDIHSIIGCIKHNSPAPSSPPSYSVYEINTESQVVSIYDWTGKLRSEVKARMDIAEETLQPFVSHVFDMLQESTCKKAAYHGYRTLSSYVIYNNVLLSMLPADCSGPIAIHIVLRLLEGWSSFGQITKTARRESAVNNSIGIFAPVEDIRKALVKVLARDNKLMSTLYSVLRNEVHPGMPMVMQRFRD